VTIGYLTELVDAQKDLRFLDRGPNFPVSLMFVITVTAGPRPGVQRLIDLVHRRDVLLHEREKMTATIDAELSRIETELAAAAGIISTKDAPPEAARQRSLALHVRPGSFAEKILLALAAKPDIRLGELAQEVYGEDTAQTRHKIRAAVFHLRKTNRLTRSEVAK
jgi:hypothetical protein